jgi:uncharacterized membrane protein (DUF2068 family)
LQKSSSDSALATINAHRIAAIVFAAGAVLCAMLFSRGLSDERILSGTFTYGLICAVISFGLWRRRSWARSLGLVLVVGNVGLGLVQLSSSFLIRKELAVEALVVIGVSVLLGYLLRRPVPERATEEPT